MRSTTLILALCLTFAAVALAPAAEAHSQKCNIGDVVCLARCEVRHLEAPLDDHGCYFMG